MKKLNLFISKNVNYNLIYKKNLKSVKDLSAIKEIQINVNNKFIGSSYLTLLLLTSLNFITKSKSSLRKSTKDILLFGIRKNDTIGLKINLRGGKLNYFFSKVVFSYFNLIDFSRLFIKKKNFPNIFPFTLKNIQKIDSRLAKEHKILKTMDWDLIIKSKTLNKIELDLLLSHCKFPINKL